MRIYCAIEPPFATCKHFRSFTCCYALEGYINSMNWKIAYQNILEVFMDGAPGSSQPITNTSRDLVRKSMWMHQYKPLPIYNWNTNEWIRYKKTNFNQNLIIIKTNSNRKYLSNYNLCQYYVYMKQNNPKIVLIHHEGKIFHLNFTKTTICDLFW